MIRWARAVICDAFYKLSASARLTWFTLCMFASWNKELTRGECFPSLAAIAKLSGLSTRTISRNILELEALGMVTRYTNRTEKKANKYVLCPNVTPCHMTQCHTDSDTVSHDIRHSVSLDKTQCLTNNTINNTNNRSIEQGDESNYEIVGRRLAGFLEAEYHE